jgi:anti-anti-sigma regulatory factor
MTSLMLAKLTALNRKIQEAGGRLALCSASPEVSQVFKVTFLDKILNLCTDQPEALQSFKT